MSDITPDQRTEMANAIRDFFGLDAAKVEAWWRAPNPMLGGVSPTVLTLMGREDKLYQFVMTSIEEGEGSSRQAESQQP